MDNQADDQPNGQLTQTTRRAPRRAALHVQAVLHAPRAERERRVSSSGVTLMVALSERDEAVAVRERRPRQALLRMTGAGGLTVRQAVHWCGTEPTPRAAKRRLDLALRSGAVPTTSHPGRFATSGLSPEPAMTDPMLLSPVEAAEVLGIGRSSYTC